MTDERKHSVINYFIAAVWLINGLLCKVLNLVPRHERIVASLLGDEFSRPLTVFIGILEIAMTLWVLSRFKSRLNALVQISVVAIMNVLEFLLVPNLLLWGRLNAIFALLFIVLVYYNEFILNKKQTPQSEMLKILKNHPFAVEAFFESSLVLTFAIPKQQLLRFIPECLELDTFEDKWAFLAVAMVQTSGLRPKGFPKFMGNDFFLIGYRIFVRYTNKAGKRLRGLYILKSETDKKKMEWLGNIFTHYHYSTIDVHKFKDGHKQTVKSVRSPFQVTIEEQTDKEIRIPFGSPFIDWKDARKFAGPLPFTFTYDQKEKTVLIIEGVRQNWQPAPVKVSDYEFGFLNKLNLQGVVLANAFVIKNIPYQWKKGKREKWG